MIKIINTNSRDIVAIANRHFSGIEANVRARIDRSLLHSSDKVKLNKDLKDIILGKPEYLIKKHKRFYNVKSLLYSSYRGRIVFQNEIRKIFSYSAFCSWRNWNPYILSDSLDVKTCVYCNRQFTFTIKNLKANIIRPEIDHFFSQSKYPLLALSFYNLIPSCHICNSNLKGEKEIKLHPYEQGFGNDATFTYSPKDFAALIGLSDNMEINVIRKKDINVVKKIDRNIEVFHVEEIYTKHSDYVQEIIKRNYECNGDYLKMLANIMPGVSSNELYRLAYSNYEKEEDFEKRILSKVTRDIVGELKLFKSAFSKNI